MRDNVPTNDTDHSLAKKRLAVGLRNIVIGQMYALYVLALGTLILCIAFVFRWKNSDGRGMFGATYIGFEGENAECVVLAAFIKKENRQVVFLR